MPSRISKDLIAPCGMNCAICKAYLRRRHPCHGCRGAALNRPPTRMNCRIRLCAKRESHFCDCAEFPCDRLKHLDHRYRTRYGISEIANLDFIREKGIRMFLESERERWISEKGTLCVHDRNYYR